MTTSIVLLVSILIVSLTFSLLTHASSSTNPFTAKDALLRYWSHKIPAGTRRPEFLVSKLSPLSALDSTTYSSLAADGSAALSARLSPFCTAAHLLCTLATPSLVSHHPDQISPVLNIHYKKSASPSGRIVPPLHPDQTISPVLSIYKNSALMSHFTAADSTTSVGMLKLVFFRERSLQSGAVMPMPDITDKMPERSFLPRSIAQKIPFSAAGDVLRLFQFPNNGSMGKAVRQTVAECQLEPSHGESKKCATSAEDMLDFVSSKLGSGAVARSTESTGGSHSDVLIGDVRGVDGGNELKLSVSCHQMMFPYLVYYCHSVPSVRVYEAELLDPKSKKKINNGVAVCHADTSDWSPEHGAFVALGSGPGKIEVCHWIFQGDFTWTAT